MDKITLLLGVIIMLTSYLFGIGWYIFELESPLYVVKNVGFMLMIVSGINLFCLGLLAVATE